MEIDKLNSLVELYFKKCEEVDPNKPFLKWLKPGKPTYSWGEVKDRIFKLSSKIKSLIKEGDRCLILSENRPYWLISDLAVMNAGGISVPIFTTYSSNDYEYILNDCKPSLIIVSNNDQYKKIKNHINLNEQKIISFEEIDTDSLLIQNILDEENFKKGLLGSTSSHFLKYNSTRLLSLSISITWWAKRDSNSQGIATTGF